MHFALGHPPIDRITTCPFFAGISMVDPANSNLNIVVCLETGSPGDCIDTRA